MSLALVVSGFPAGTEQCQVAVFRFTIVCCFCFEEPVNVNVIHVKVCYLFLFART
jgi:hypothetical protein